MAHGAWLKTLNNQGSCYLYVHTVSHEIRGTRPEEYVETGSTATGAEPLEAFSPLQTSIYPIHLWQQLAQSCAGVGKVPLLLVSDTDDYLQLQHLLEESSALRIDTRPMVLPYARSCFQRVAYP